MPSLSSSRKRQALFPFVTGVESSAISHRRRSVSALPKFCYTASMKRLILKNWRAKLISLLLATTLWFLIKKNVATTHWPSERPHRPQVSETQYQLFCSHRQVASLKEAEKSTGHKPVACILAIEPLCCKRERLRDLVGGGC